MKIKEKLFILSIIFTFFIYIFSINNVYATVVTSDNMQIQDSYINLAIAKKGGGHSSSSLKKKSTNSTDENLSQSASSTSSPTKSGNILGNILTVIFSLIGTIALVVSGILFAHKKKKKLI